MIASRAAAVRLLALAFALGALVTGGVLFAADRAGSKTECHGPPQRSYLSRLTEDLGLTDAQQAAAKDVLDRHELVMDSVWAEVRVYFDAPRQAFRRDIRALLTPDQAVKYDSIVARRDSVQRARGKHEPKK